ncbi:hypothetical protein NI17_016935 [Thermobifida halotolerans]|uniref:Uncharacterized protein n=1 Tax=Thermobifida halotolerans TaxID=483545 RepID=A0A399G1I3_9ACTN|nr:hypothetical protein [Thermobifida halotolerans]UOE18496.1 hypothetical protein NI17_016935 [Thermobifida halotolerans]
MSDEAGGNPIEGYEGAELAEALAESMAGLADMFDLIMEDAETVVRRDEISAALRVYREEYGPALVEVQEHGLQLAENIKAGASEIALNDYEAAENYSTPWELGMDLQINF